MNPRISPNTNPFLLFIAVSSKISFSERVEVHIAHPEQGVIVLIED